MSRESELKAILLADATIFAKTSNRIFTSEEIGDSGLTSENAPSIYSAGGDIQPSVYIKLREDIADGQAVDPDEGESSSLQVIEIYAYEENGYVDIDIILGRSKRILPSKILGDSFELEWILTTGRLRDDAALAGASLVRQDWSIPGFS